MDILYTLLTVVLVVVIFVGHEAGHFVAMRRQGIEVPSAGFGFITGTTITLKKSPWGLKKINLGYVPLGAYVLPSDEGQEKLDKLPYGAYSWCLGAGVWANVMIGFGLMVSANLIMHSWTRALIEFGILVVLWFGRKVFAYIVPYLGVAALALTVWAYIAQPTAGWVEFGTAMHSTGLVKTLTDGAAVSLGMGAFNMIPMTPLDGGKMARHLLRGRVSERADNILVWTGVALVLSTFVYGFLIDVLKALW